MIRLLCCALPFLLAAGCESAEDRFRNTGVTRGGPEVESIPGPLKSCGAKPRPRVTLLAPPTRVPLRIRVLRSYHACLGEFVALLRLEHTGGKRIAGLVLEREWWDVHRRRPPRRDRQIVIRDFAKGTVRYLRIRWRGGYANPGERQLRLRLARLDFADGTRWSAGAWPSVPPPRAPARPAASLPERLHQARDPLHKATHSLKQLRKKLEDLPLVRHRPSARP